MFLFISEWFHEWKTWERSEWVARWKKRQDRFLSHRMLRRKLRNVVTTAIDFEANHKECVRVLPYFDGGHTKVHFYVFSGKSDVPQKLQDAAQECFGEMKVKLEWFDLYNDATEILKATRIEFPSGKLERLNESQIYEINEAINKNLHVLVKHRNITAVQASFKITNSKQTKRPCIAIYVLGKGSIPLGEFQFPRTLGDYDVDVVDGFWFRTGKDDPWKPEKGQEPREVLRLGASIGVRGEKGCGTLGAILESDGNFYALSCDHVMKHPQREIIHPAQDDYLNYLNYHLQEYAKQIRYIIKREQRYILETQLSYGILKEVEPLNQKFQELKSIKKDHFDQQRAREENVEEANRHERALERGLRTQPRVIGRYNAGISHNVEWTNNQEYFIDAAIALLNSEEVDSLRNIDLPEVIGTVKLPSGRFTSRFTAFGDLCKSGRTTEFTENGCHARPNMYLRDTSYQLNARYPNLVNIVKQVSLCQGCFEASGVQDDLTRTLPPCSYCEEDRITLRDSVWWKNCLCIDCPYDPATGERFSAEGDSGAVIFEIEGDGSLLGFGIIFARQCHSYGPCTLASPLRPALETLSRNISQNASLRLLSKYND